MNKTQIVKEGWDRREIFDFFSSVSDPFYMLTFKQDVTNLYAYTKKHGISFYYALVYLCTRAVNSVEAFSYAVEGEKIFRLDERIPSFTDLKKGSELFHIVTMEAGGSLLEFCRRAAETSDAQEVFIRHESEGDNLIYFSCAPWVVMTALTNERDLSAPQARDESIPHIAWGRYEETDGGRKQLCISIEVNHRFIDGIHIGRFHQALTEMIEAL